MMRSKLGALALCAVVLGVMAFAASGAQAEATASWLILTSSGQHKTGVELNASLGSELENKDGSLLTKVLGLKVKILCTEMALDNAQIGGPGTIFAGFLALFTGCETFINDVLEPACLPSSTGQPPDTIKTNDLKGLAVLIGGSKRVRIDPQEAGKPIVTITFSDEECVLPSIPIFGVLYIKDCKEAFSTHLVKHLIEEDTVNSKLWAISHTAEHLETSLDGSAEVFLIGAHTGLKWSGDV